MSKSLPLRGAFAIALIITSCATHNVSPTSSLDEAYKEVSGYRAELREQRRGRPLRSLPAVDFFLFGMGQRPKLLLRDGVLTDARTSAVIRDFDPTETVIVPSAYSVWMRTPSGVVAVVEDEIGVKIVEGSKQTWLSRHPLHLPSFSGRRFGRVMRVLHHEILINIVDSKPLPNFFVYGKPWYRDAAMMMMVLQRTGNAALTKSWVNGLNSPFDRNNKGEEEADNPGQALFMISVASNKTHPLVPQLLASLRRFEVEGGAFIKGRSDYAFHPVYQTRWAKFGLASLGLPDPYQVPQVQDTYDALFWWGDNRTAPTPAVFNASDTKDYPYLAWAQDHRRGTAHAPLGDRDYPLSWEANASEAHYEGMGAVSSAFVVQKIAAPHTWHAAEMFLLLDEQRP